MEAQNISYVVLSIILSICIIIICRYLIPWLKTKFSKESFDLVSKWVLEAVKAAEQTHGEGEGKAKKEEVVKFVKQMLEKYHIVLSEQEIDTLIESAVKQLKIELLAASSN